VGGQDKHTALEGRVVEELAAVDEKVIGSGAGIGLFIKDKLNTTKLNPLRIYNCMILICGRAIRPTTMFVVLLHRRLSGFTVTQS